ncbi:MAG: hypothetical protein IJK85_05005, partial [Bacteroidales bacterium]|nr:hypothetical protein [Bacteroidales bacterium]
HPRPITCDTIPVANQPIRAEGLGRNVDDDSGFAHAVGVRASWKTVWDSILPADLTACDNTQPHLSVLPSPADLTACQHPRPKQIRTTTLLAFMHHVRQTTQPVNICIRNRFGKPFLLRIYLRTHQTVPANTRDRINGTPFRPRNSP